MTSTAVLLTPPSAAAIAVIRLAGPLNSAFAAAHLTRSPRVGRCVHCDLRDGETTIDDVLAVATPAGALDLNVHGGSWVIEATRQLAARFGYAVRPWRDAADAFDTEDDIERQVLLDLPGARSLEVVRLLAAQPTAWRAMLASRDVAALRRAVADTALAVALTTPTVAIVGPPNVGKSTLANALFGRERSITADGPGTTRDWVGEPADVGGLVVRLIDTPGVRTTDDAIEAAAIEAAGGVAAAADLIVVVVDGSIPLTAATAGLIEQRLGRAGTTPASRQAASDAAKVPALVVRTKADRPPRCVLDRRAVDVSAVRGDGLDALRQAIRDSLGCADLTSPHARCWTHGQRDRATALLSKAGGASTIGGPGTAPATS